MLIPYFTIIVFVCVVTSLITYGIARYRNSDVRYWVFMAFLIGPFALPLVFFSRPLPHS